jgi:DNA-binding MarR family transcriptional regulator
MTEEAMMTMLSKLVPSRPGAPHRPDNTMSSTLIGVTDRMEALHAKLFEAAGVSRRWGETLAGHAGQTQARWQTMWTAGSGSFTVPQIARRLGVTRQNVQRLANELVDEGLAVYTDNPDHKASPLLELTPHGQNVLTTINAAAARGNQELLERLSQRRVDQLHNLLDQLIDAINEVHSTGVEPVPDQQQRKRGPADPPATRQPQPRARQRATTTAARANRTRRRSPDTATA